MSLSPNTIDLVKSCVPLLQAEGEAVTTRMYEILFSKYPETQALFERAENQPSKLAAAVGAYAANIDKLDNLGGAVEKMATSHVKTHVEAKHYPMVADALLNAMVDVLGSDVINAEMQAAWAEAYQFLADILIAREAELYAEQA